MNTYTANTGLTPQGQQVAQSQPNATNTVPPPGSSASAYPSDQSLNQQYADANANSVSLATPEARQGYITNSNIPAMQSNYDDLARQLFEYDQGKLAPQFQGQNPGTPGDAASFGRVDASPLGMTLQAAGLPASQGIYNANPKYAYAAQTSQADSLSNLLDILNRGIGSTFSSAKGLYANKTDAAQKALDNIIKIMTLKQDAADKAAARAGSGGIGSVNDAAAHAQADAAKGVTFSDMVMRYGGTLPSYTIREIYNNANYYNKPAQETESDIAAMLAGGKPANVQKQLEQQQSKDQAYNLAKNTIQNILGQYNNLGSWDKGGFLGSINASNPYSAGAEYEKQRKGLVAALKDVAGAGEKSGVRVTQAELNTWANLLPSPGKTEDQVKTDIKSLDTQLRSKFGRGLDEQYSGVKNTVQVQSPDGTVWDIPSENVQAAVNRGGKVVQ